jgi:hypothetical protein
MMQEAETAQDFRGVRGAKKIMPLGWIRYVGLKQAESGGWTNFRDWLTRHLGIDLVATTEW